MSENPIPQYTANMSDAELLATIRQHGPDAEMIPTGESAGLREELHRRNPALHAVWDILERLKRIDFREFVDGSPDPSATLLAGYSAGFQPSTHTQEVQAVYDTTYAAVVYGDE